MNDLLNPNQAAAIPFRHRDGQVEICLITSSGKGKWIFPKGLIDPGDTMQQTALKESEEEAGIRGELHPEALGDYRYRKWGTELLVRVYLMEVREELAVWDEMTSRRREWVSPEEAIRRLAQHPGFELVELAVARLGEG